MTATAEDRTCRLCGHVSPVDERPPSVQPWEVRDALRTWSVLACACIRGRTVGEVLETAAAAVGGTAQGALRLDHSVRHD